MHKRTLLMAAAGLTLSLPAMAQQGLNAGPLQPLLNLFSSTEVGADTFVQQAAYGDAFEIESSRILLNGSQHPNLRQYAEQMIQHHTMSSNMLRSVPEGATRFPVGLDERRQRMLFELRQHEGDMLNRHYVQQQIQSHEESELLYRTYAENGDVPVLKAFAQRVLPIVREHLQMARALQAPGGQQ
jgi:putative membrane protein